jgi:hypothetical protein
MKIYKITMVQVGSQKYKGIYIFFSFHILLTAKIWLNQLMDDHHIGYITQN